MLTPPPSQTRLTFGPFEVNAGSGELFKHGVRIRLPRQPLQILLTLLEQPGELVTREQLLAKIWGDGTFVDFEHGLNAAMNRLRQTLGDSAEKPRYIETVRAADTDSLEPWSVRPRRLFPLTGDRRFGKSLRGGGLVFGGRLRLPLVLPCFVRCLVAIP